MPNVIKKYKSNSISKAMGKDALENTRDSYYPYITYSPSRQWCAFSFNLMVQLFDSQKGYVKPADDKYNEQDIINYKEIVAKNLEKFTAKFPFDELVKAHEQEEYIKRFTGINDKVMLIPREDPLGILIASNIPIYAPQLNMAIDHSFLQANLHNGGNATIGLLMTAYGLRALKTIYDAYGVNSYDLPRLDFQKNKMSAVIPIVHLDEKRNYDFQIKIVKPKVLENTLEFSVPYSIGDAKLRSEVAFALLEKTSQQAQRNLTILENGI